MKDIDFKTLEIYNFSFPKENFMSFVFDFSQKKNIEKFKNLNFLMKCYYIKNIQNVDAEMVVTLIDDIKILNLLLKKGVFSAANKTKTKILRISQDYEITQNLDSKEKLKWLIENNIAEMSINKIPAIRSLSLQHYAFEEFESEIRKNSDDFIDTIIAKDNLDLFMFAVKKLNIDLFNHDKVDNICKKVNDFLYRAFLFNAYHVAEYLLENGFSEKIYEEKIQDEISFKSFKQKEYRVKKEEEAKLKIEHESLKNNGSLTQIESSCLFNRAFLTVLIKTLEEEKRMIDLFDQEILKQKRLLNETCGRVEKTLKIRL